MINVQGLHKSFGKLKVLNGIDLEIPQGEVVVVIGPSGSGKSTFLRCLNLLEVPTSGEVTFEGHRVTDPKLLQLDLISEKLKMHPFEGHIFSLMSLHYFEFIDYNTFARKSCVRGCFGCPNSS